MGCLLSGENVIKMLLSAIKHMDLFSVLLIFLTLQSKFSRSGLIFSRSGLISVENPGLEVKPYMNASA
jgi:hypothetical protein